MMGSLATWKAVVLLLALAPFGYYVTATIAALRFFRRERQKRLEGHTPPVSILKPVRGVDFASEENFRSFCEQDYPEYEVLFCVNDLSDPAVPLIEKLRAAYPKARVRLLNGARQIGSNRKVNNLALLTAEAKYDVLMQSDGDVRVGPRYLRELAAAFQDPEVGVVSCFYRGVAESNLWAELEAVGATSDFAAGAMVADWKEGVTFALGASVATTKAWLGKIGGYEALVNVLADDYEIGNRVHKAGGKVLLSRESVWTMYPAQTVRSAWEHQVRWARTTRICRPGSYYGLVLTQGLPWTVLATLVAPTAGVAAGYWAAYVVLRLAMAWTAGVWGVGDELLRKRMWLVPLRDAFYFAVWVASFGSNRVNWGGKTYEIVKGEMREVDAS